MRDLKILNSKEIKEILSQIEEQWGAKINLDYGFLKNQKDKVYLINKKISDIDLSKLRINSLGLYFCEVGRGIRLTIEGSQMVGPKSAKNVAEITKEQAYKWMSGEDIEIEGNYSGFVILKCGNDYLGSGKFRGNRILNYVGKERRVSSVN